jgi:alpha-galactosidase
MLAAGLSAATLAGDYDARIAENEILTPAPAKAPRINGPKLYGARPGKKFIYRIPTQGERPIRFSVEGLPDSFELDAEQGIITGTVPQKRADYALVFAAENGHGKAERPFRLVVGDKLALTPPTGWNHWGGHASNISDEIIRAAAELFIKRGLADVGFQYIGIDDCWMRLSPAEYRNVTKDPDGFYMMKHKGIDFDKMVGEPRDAAGNIIPNGYFPDMKGLVDDIHALGLKAGIYSSPGPLTCQNLEGSRGHEEQDAKQYAEWGFDLLKYDRCTAGGIINQLKKKENPLPLLKEFWRAMVGFLEETDRDIVVNLCQYGHNESWKWAPSIGVQSWRISGDLNHHINDYFKAALRIATDLREYSQPGQWNDPDFMYVGRQVQTRFNHFAQSQPTGLTGNQEYQYVSLWAMICAPFFFSTDVLHVDDFTIGLLSNPDVMDISQDELGRVAGVIRNDGNQVVLAKKLVDGSTAVALFNTDPENEAVIQVDWADFGGCCEMEVFDVWRQKDLGVYEPGISVRLSPNGVALLKIRG